MVTWPDVFTFCLVVIAALDLALKFYGRKKE